MMVLCVGIYEAFMREWYSPTTGCSVAERVLNAAVDICVCDDALVYDSDMCACLSLY